MAFDLDDEELRATRKLNGLDKERSDKDVVNDSVIAHKFAIMQQQIAEKDKRIKELEEDNKKLKTVRIEYDYGYENTYLLTKNDLVRIDKNKYMIEVEDGKFVDVKQLYIDTLNSIPKQKIRDKIEELKDGLKKTTEGKLQMYTPSEFIYQTQVLEELLEGEKEV